MEQRTGRLAAFFDKGPVKFIGAAGLCLAVAAAGNMAIETYGQPDTTPASVVAADSSNPGKAVATDAAVAGNEEAPSGGIPVRDSATATTHLDKPYVPQSVGHYAFRVGMYDWQTFMTRTNDLAGTVDSPYADDLIRALPQAADRAAVLGTGPHKLLHDTEGKALSVTYLSQHYHLDAEGLAVAVSDNPAYEHSPIRVIADNAHLLAQAAAIGQNPDAIRALAKDVHVLQIGAAPTPETEHAFKVMNTGDLATYALVMGEAAYVTSALKGDTKGQEKIALLIMAGAEAQYQDSRTHGKFHDLPMDPEWAQQVASANATARFARVEKAKLTGEFKGLQTVDALQPIMVAEKTGRAVKTDVQER